MRSEGTGEALKKWEVTNRVWVIWILGIPNNCSFFYDRPRSATLRILGDWRFSSLHTAALDGVGRTASGSGWHFPGGISQPKDFLRWGGFSRNQFDSVQFFRLPIFSFFLPGKKLCVAFVNCFPLIKYPFLLIFKHVWNERKDSAHETWKECPVGSGEDALSPPPLQLVHFELVIQLLTDRR